MGRFVKGEVVVIPFPFSDLSQSKRRPALVVASLTGNDLILCMITSQHTGDADAILLREVDFTSGSLHQVSYIRPNRLFTADDTLVIRSIGQISEVLTMRVVEQLITIFTR